MNRNLPSCEECRKLSSSTIFKASEKAIKIIRECLTTRIGMATGLFVASDGGYQDEAQPWCILPSAFIKMGNKIDRQ
jgi:hypothetical protein